MPDAKTTPTTASVKAYLDAIEDDERRKDCKTLVTMMKRVTGCTPKMWGPSIVGFGTYQAAALFTALGPHKFGTACLYIKRLADMQVPVLE